MADFNEYKGVWVFCEQRQGALMSTDFELVSEARKLADELGCEVTGLLLGDNVEGIAKELGGYGADKVMVCDSPLLKDYTTDAYAKVVCDMVNEYKPEVLLIGATNIGRDLGPRCAARLHTGLTADATHLDIDTAKYIDFLKESSTIDLSKQKFDMEDRNLKSGVCGNLRALQHQTGREQRQLLRHFRSLGGKRDRESGGVRLDFGLSGRHIPPRRPHHPR